MTALALKNSELVKNSSLEKDDFMNQLFTICRNEFGEDIFINRVLKNIKLIYLINMNFIKNLYYKLLNKQISNFLKS